MSSIMEMLEQQLRSPQAVSALERQAGVGGAQAQQAISAALPMLLAGLAKNSQNEQGAASLWSALDKDHDGNVLNDLAGFLGSGQAQQNGMGILGHIFGNRQPQAEQSLAKASGLNSQNAGQILAALAPVVMGFLGKMQNQKQIQDRQQLGSLLNEEAKNLKNNPNTGGLLNMLMDADGDGDVDLGDVVKRGGLLARLFGKR